MIESHCSADSMGTAPFCFRLHLSLPGSSSNKVPLATESEGKKCSRASRSICKFRPQEYQEQARTALQEVCSMESPWQFHAPSIGKLSNCGRNGGRAKGAMCLTRRGTDLELIYECS